MRGRIRLSHTESHMKRSLEQKLDLEWTNMSMTALTENWTKVS